jgi:hypothetical protein
MEKAKKVLGAFLNPHLFALLGGVLYLVQSWYYAHIHRVVIDEALYLYKGYLYATGVYRPFQDFGPWTQKAPLAYLIPGYIETWFGPGLRSGRYFAILLGLSTLAGLWLAARRLGGKWWAAAAVWAVAINPTLVRQYSLAASEVLIACLLVWTLALVLGKGQPFWQLLLGGVLAAIMSMTRQNMAPVLFFVIIYLFWQHGRRAGWWCLLASAVPILIIHAIYWPNILRMWAPWLPAGLTPFLDSWRPPTGLQPGWISEGTPFMSLQSFFQTFRPHFLALAGGFTALLLWPRKEAWKKDDHFLNALLLAVLFIVLFAEHAWAGVGYSSTNNNCVYCFVSYVSFFSLIGILLLPLLLGDPARHVPVIQQILYVVLLLVIFAGIGYTVPAPASASITLPRLKTFFQSGEWQPGYPLWSILVNLFGGDYLLSQRMVPAITGVLVALMILLLSYFIWRRYRRIRMPPPAFSYISTATLLAIGVILSPTQLLGGNSGNYDCGTDQVKALEQYGHALAQQISPGSRVYWDGDWSEALLLYLPGIRVFPQQLDGKYSFWYGGDPQALARYGFWNDQLRSQWIGQADYIVMEQNQYDSVWEDYFASGAYDRLPPSPPLLVCDSNSRILVFHKKP